MPLSALHTTGGVNSLRLWLDDSETQTLLSTLRANSDAAAARLAAAARHHLDRRVGGWSADRPADVAAALHRLLTRSRFLKGSRSCFPLATAIDQISPFVEQRRPVTIMVSGFPFKQHDNGLKAGGPWPDLAEYGALLRLGELHRAFSALYPLGLHIVVLSDGGYLRPRGWVEVAHYRYQLKRYARLAGLSGIVHFRDQSRYVAGVLGSRGWSQRESYRRTFRRVISMLAGGACPPAASARVDELLMTAFGQEVLAGVPGFRDILSSLVYSVPVPTPDGVDPQRWACDALAGLDDRDPTSHEIPGYDDELAMARRKVIETAWQDTVNYLAASVADGAAGVSERQPPHVRLATVASRQGCSGFSYLGGSALLPWHGTGCLDGRGRVCADFAVSLNDRGFLPVYTELIGEQQPLLMVPYPKTVFSDGRRRIDSDLLSAARLRAR